MTDSKEERGTAPARKRPTGLGRGLNALFGDAAVESPVLASPGTARPAAPAAAADSVQHIAVGAIRPLPGQPRRHFDEGAIAELAESIAARGLLQPIIVRRTPGAEGYQLVAGRSEEHTSELQSLMRISYAVFCLKKKNTKTTNTTNHMVQ